MPARKAKPDERPQRERFIETAREIGADETPERFERAFNFMVRCPKSDQPVTNSSTSATKTRVSKK